LINKKSKEYLLTNSSSLETQKSLLLESLDFCWLERGEKFVFEPLHQNLEESVYLDSQHHHTFKWMIPFWIEIITMK